MNLLTKQNPYCANLQSPFLGILAHPAYCFDNLLPGEIAARLQSSPGAVIADDLPEVAILSSDIVDFTLRKFDATG